MRLSQGEQTSSFSPPPQPKKNTKKPLLSFPVSINTCDRGPDFESLCTATHIGSKTYLDLPSLAYDYEYSIVICADDDEYAGRNKIIQKVCHLSLVSTLSHPPLTLCSQFASLEDPGIIRPGTSAGAGHDGRCRKLLDISGRDTTVELLEMGPETDQAMLRYQIEYADAFAFVFSLYSQKTLETAQTLHDKVQGAARNYHNIVTMSDYDKASGGMTVPVFLIGNRDADLAPPQGEFSCQDGWLGRSQSRSYADLGARDGRGRLLADDL